MGKLRRWNLLFITSTVLFVGIYLEILTPLPDLESHLGVYLLVMVAILGEFVLPSRLFKPPYYVLLAAVFLLVGGLYLLPTSLSPEEVKTAFFSLAIELSFIAWLVYASHAVSAALRPLEAREEILRVIGVEDPSIDIQAAASRIHAEITRSRHYERPLTVVVIESADLLEPGALQGENDSFSKWVTQEFTRARFARTIKRELRAMDLVLKDPENHNLVLICPEISTGDVHEVVRHLETVVHREFGIQSLVASASFPEDGISFEGLYQQAAENLAQKVEDVRRSATKTKLGVREKIYVNE